VPIPGTKYKRSKNSLFVISIALICGRMWARLLQPLAQSPIGSPGTLGQRFCFLGYEVGDTHVRFF